VPPNLFTGGVVVTAVVAVGVLEVAWGVVVLELPQLAIVETSTNRITSVANNFFKFPPLYGIFFTEEDGYYLVTCISSPLIFLP
jgi:hypothetical protein